MLTKISDFLLAPIVALAALPMRLARRGHLDQRPITRSVLKRKGIFPLRDHYYEPQFAFTARHNFSSPRNLPGIAFNRDGQRALLETFDGLNIPA
jgi:hypothetical protein